MALPRPWPGHGGEGEVALPPWLILRRIGEHVDLIGRRYASYVLPGDETARFPRQSRVMLHSSDTHVTSNELA